MVFYLCTLFSYCVYNIGALTSLILYNIVFYLIFVFIFLWIVFCFTITETYCKIIYNKIYVL